MVKLTTLVLLRIALKYPYRIRGGASIGNPGEPGNKRERGCISNTSPCFPGQFCSETPLFFRAKVHFSLDRGNFIWNTMSNNVNRLNYAVFREGGAIMKRAVGYVRVSTQEQVDGTSLTSQEEQIRAYATLKGLDLVDVLIDGGISGGKPLGDRPEGRKLADMVDAGEVQAVIITKLDRGFRSTVDCLQTVQAWEKGGIALHICDMGGSAVDTTSPAGRFMLTVLVAAAEMERGRIRERCNEGRRARKSQGYRIGEIPFGWDLGEGGRLVKVDSEQEIIQRVRSLKAKGWSFRQIAEDLNRDGLRTKKGAAWTHVQVASVYRRAA